MNAPRTIDETHLHAYVDGQLDDSARLEVESWLAEHPNEAARVQAYRVQNAGLHELFDGVLDEPVPERLGVTATPARRSIAWLRIAAAIVLFAAGAVSGWGLRGLPTVDDATTEPALVNHAVGAYLVYASEVRHPVEVGADEEAHLVAWLSKRLGQTLRTPNFGGAGFRLVGGRLLPDEGRPAAQFMYEDAGGRRLTVYLRTADKGEDTAFRFVEDRGVSAFYWVDAPLSYALTGKIPRAELLSLARTCYEQFER